MTPLNLSNLPQTPISGARRARRPLPADLLSPEDRARLLRTPEAAYARQPDFRDQPEETKRNRQGVPPGHVIACPDPEAPTATPAA